MVYTYQGPMMFLKKVPAVDKEAVVEVEEVVAEDEEETSTISLHHYHQNQSNQPTSFAGPAERKGSDQQIALLKL